MTQIQDEQAKCPLKILHAGFHRSGTVSVAIALEKLGFGPSWHYIHNKPFFTRNGMNWWLKNDCENYNKALRGEYIDYNEWFNILQCQTVMDVPTLLFFEQMFKQFPNVKVIVPLFYNPKNNKNILDDDIINNNKDFNKWHKSMCGLLKWICLGNNFKIVSKFLPAIDFVYSKYFYKLIEPLTLDEFLDEKNNKLKVLKWYNNKLENIIKIVPKEQLLLFDVRDGWEPLCKFLNVDIPINTPFPRANDGISLKKALRKSIGPLIVTPKFIFIIIVLFFSFYLSCFN